MTSPTRAADLNSNITRAVRVLMALHGGMTQTELADAIGLHKTLVSRSFRGDRAWKIEDIDALSRLFAVGVEVFFDDAEALVRSRCSPSDDPDVITESELIAA